jgi:hypothetical protein
MASLINNPKIHAEHQDDEQEKAGKDDYFMRSGKHSSGLF